MTTDDRDLEAAMAELRTHAPPTLAPGVLVEVGLADRYARFDSPIGPLVVAWNGRRRVRGRGGPRRCRVRGGAPGPDRAPAHPGRTAAGTTRRGDRPTPRAATAASGSISTCAVTPSSSASVWHKALEIPRGEVRPYGWIAAEIGRPRAVRAVGTALGHNPVPLIVPCHRVVRTDGTIGQYSLGGPHNKRTILAAEGLDPDATGGAGPSGVRFIGSDTTQIVCLPTCRHARRVSDRAPRRVPVARRRSRPWLPRLPRLPAGVGRSGLTRS